MGNEYFSALFDVAVKRKKVGVQKLIRTDRRQPARNQKSSFDNDWPLLSTLHIINGILLLYPRQRNLPRQTAFILQYDSAFHTIPNNKIQ
ncbi:MAG: hypothetical protein AB7V25_13160 [Mangrovibacterium sp.]